MSFECMIQLTIRTEGRTSKELLPVLLSIYRSGVVRKPDLGGSVGLYGMDGQGTAQTINADFTVVADDDDELIEAARKLFDSLRVLEIEVVGQPELLSSRKLEPPRSTAAGVEYDQAAGTLTIDTWGPD